jgi:T4 RnlA family RNA ligase
MAFPVITHIDEFKAAVKEKGELHFKTYNNNCTVCCYVFQDSHTFSGENAMWYREARGITFGPDGNLLIRPYHKFFNVDEKVETKEAVLDWSKVVEIADKRDGSCIMCGILDGELLWKSKKVFDSDVALLVKDRYTADTPEYKLAFELCKLGLTPIFELTSPVNRIVLEYKEYQLTLLSIRVNSTGEYKDRVYLEQWCNEYKVPLVDSYMEQYKEHGLTPFKERLENDTGFEGYVVTFEDGTMVKFKSKWYLMLHHVVSFVHQQNVVTMVLDEQIDDYKSYLNSLTDTSLIAKVEEIESTVLQDLLSIQSFVECTVNAKEFDNPRDFSIKYNTHEYFHLLISLFRGKEPNYKEFYRSRILEVKFSKECI